MSYIGTELKYVIDNLKAARQLISNKDNWTTGWFARDFNGSRVHGAHKLTAISFCSIGAINKVTNNTCGIQTMIEFEIKYLFRAIDYKCNVTYYNDTHTHEEVLAMFDKAIELASVDLINAETDEFFNLTDIDPYLQTR
jgi:hypothetical protein